MKRFCLVAVLVVSVACSGSSSAPASPSTPTPSPTPTPAPAPAPAPTLPVRGAQFDQTFWNEFVHNSFDNAGRITPLQRLTAAPMLYIRTVDEAGQPIDSVTLDTVQNAMTATAATWGGGQFGLAGVVRGTDTMARVHGWLTVKWPNPSAGAFCGRSDVGADGGVIELNYLRQDTTCGCNGSRMRTRTARHELGHAFGFYHTDSDGDVMRNGVNGCTETMPSAREVYHATLAYQSPLFGTDGVTTSPVSIVID